MAVAAKKAAPKKLAKPERLVVLRSEVVPVDGLHLYYKNPNVGDVDEIAISLNENGQYKPIVVNIGTHTGRPNEILAGNHTYLATRKEVTYDGPDGKMRKKDAWGDIYAAFVDVDEARATRIVLADNETAAKAERQERIVAELIASIPPLERMGTGFNAQETEDIVARAAKDAEEALARAEEIRKQHAEEDHKRAVAKTFSGAPLGEEGDFDEDDEEDLGVSKGPKLEDANEELEGMFAFKAPENLVFPGTGPFEIPLLRDDMLMTFDELPANLDSWAGSACKNWPDPDQWWLYNWGIDSTSGMQDISKVIVSFYCVDTETEVLSKRGWLRYDDVLVGDEVWTLNKETTYAEWKSVRKVYTKRHEGTLTRIQSRSIDALVTDDHRWLVKTNVNKDLRFVETRHLNSQHAVPVGADVVQDQTPIVSDAMVELVGWFVTEGSLSSKYEYVRLYQSPSANIEWCKQIESALDTAGMTYNTHTAGVDINCYSLDACSSRRILALNPTKDLSAEFVSMLSKDQRELLLDVMIAGDGYASGSNNVQFATKSDAQAASFSMLCGLLGYSTNDRVVDEVTPYGLCRMHRITVKIPKYAWVAQMTENQEQYEGLVWCLNTENQSFFARRNGKTYFTGNCFDHYFDRWWYVPEKYTAKVLNSGIKYILTPNFSQSTDLPKVESLWALYRARWLGRYFQEAGLKLIPDITWRDGDMEWLKRYVLGTLKTGMPLIAMQMQTIDPKEVTGGIEHLEAQVKLVFDTLKPEGALIYSGNTGRELIEKVAPKGIKLRFIETRMKKLSELAKGRERKKTI